MDIHLLSIISPTISIFLPRYLIKLLLFSSDVTAKKSNDKEVRFLTEMYFFADFSNNWHLQTLDEVRLDFLHSPTYHVECQGSAAIHGEQRSRSDQSASAPI
jgi:hypothetical protein